MDARECDKTTQTKYNVALKKAPIMKVLIEDGNLVPRELKDRIRKKPLRSRAEDEALKKDRETKVRAEKV